MYQPQKSALKTLHSSVAWRSVLAAHDEHATSGKRALEESKRKFFVPFIDVSGRNDQTIFALSREVVNGQVATPFVLKRVVEVLIF